jgi:glycosyltransferase involved in cell wall biosynthesis
VTVDQILVGAAPGDAVTGIALAMRELLRLDGPSEIYARYRDPALAGDIHTLAEFPAGRRSSSDVLVYHASIGEPDVMAFLDDRPDRLIVHYHNMTPARFFRPFDERLADLLDVGRRELMELRPRVDGALADSRYNADELETLGYRDVRVVAPPVDFQHLLGQPSDPDVQRHVERYHDGPRLLFVGQVLPHKRPDLLLATVHVLRTYFGIPVFLVLVGTPRVPSYAAALQRFAEESNLAGIWLAGSQSPARLATFLRSSDILVTASEHEGFCVPLLEAMAFGKPVVARSVAAIPETLGGAGLLLPADAGPALFAEAIAELIWDPALRLELETRGYERVLDFDPVVTRAAMRAAVTELAA